MWGKYNYLVLATLVLLFSAISFAQPEVSILIVPEEPNITTFSAGYQKIYVGAISWQGYTQVTLNTSDFEVIGGNNTIPLNEQFVRFDINGSTAGLKEYSLIFTGSSPDFTINESFFVEAEPLTEGGPYVLSDFEVDGVSEKANVETDAEGVSTYTLSNIRKNCDLYVLFGKVSKGGSDDNCFISTVAGSAGSGSGLMLMLMTLVGGIVGIFFRKNS